MTTHPELSKEDRIRAIAYSIWEEEGRPDGRDEEHWLRACAIVQAEEAPNPDWLQRDVKAEVTTAIDDISKRVARSKVA